MSDVNQDDESRMLLGFLQVQRDAVLKTIEGLSEEDWQRPAVPSGWTMAGMVAHCAGVELHWIHHVTTGVIQDRPQDEDEDQGEYDRHAAFTCDWPSERLLAEYRDVRRQSDEILAVTPLSAAPLGLRFHPDPEYTAQITTVRWIVLHVIEEIAVHSGHLEIGRELLDGKTRLAGR